MTSQVAATTRRTDRTGSIAATITAKAANGVAHANAKLAKAEAVTSREPAANGLATKINMQRSAKRAFDAAGFAGRALRLSGRRCPAPRNYISKKHRVVIVHQTSRSLDWIRLTPAAVISAHALANEPFTSIARHASSKT